jgi:hypothetical protein
MVDRSFGWPSPVSATQNRERFAASFSDKLDVGLGKLQTAQFLSRCSKAK